MKKSILSILLVFAMLLATVPIMAKADTAPLAGRVATNDTGLNVRSSPATSATIISKLAKGSTVTLIKQSGDWWQVQYGKSATGYASAKYITPLTDAKQMVVAVNSGVLNVRSGAGTSYSIKTTLTKGTKVIVLSTSGNWSRILYNGTAIGYASKTYLATPTQVTPPATGTVQLSVPKFYQNDSRWSHLHLGNSSATMGPSGCATTALAMTESYRLGVTKTPATMVKELKYTSSGAVYWPSVYTQTTDSTNYLSVLKQKLEQGKPVIYGMKKTTGGMHFVVVTGFKGGSLTPANFVINDPATSSRTTLAQVQAVYPRFYKMLWVK